MPFTVIVLTVAVLATPTGVGPNNPAARCSAPGT